MADKAPTLAEIVQQAAKDADSQFSGQDHVTDAQIDAAAGAASRRCAMQAQQSLVEGLTDSIRAAMKTKARAPKAEAK